jgi:hypothetical protein
MQNSSATDLQSAIALLRGQFGSEVDQTYLDDVIIPYFLANTYAGERLFLPMIDVKFTKKNALPRYVWGVLSQTLKFAAEDGVTPA